MRGIKTKTKGEAQEENTCPEPLQKVQHTRDGHKLTTRRRIKKYIKVKRKRGIGKKESQQGYTIFYSNLD